jgi:hypothetical protein
MIGPFEYHTFAHLLTDRQVDLRLTPVVLIVDEIKDKKGDITHYKVSRVEKGGILQASPSILPANMVKIAHGLSTPDVDACIENYRANGIPKSVDIDSYLRNGYVVTPK